MRVQKTVQVDADVETADIVEDILNKTDLKPFMELGKKLWEVKAQGFTLTIPGGKLNYSPTPEREQE